MKKRTLLLSFLAYGLWAEAQSDAILENTLKTYHQSFQSEKIHVHFDKDGYLPGETIWMKAYLMEGAGASSRSKNIYFDWTDAGGKLLAHQVVPVLESTAASNFALPLDFKGGAIHLKAYTEWMLNFDPDFLFQKNIPVLTEWDGSEGPAPKAEASIRFFAEGGDLFAGIPNRVAFEVLDAEGRPSPARGVVKDAAGQVIDSLFTRHEGMGSFVLTPTVLQTYTAYWKDALGNTHSSPLPAIRPEGLGMMLKRGEDNSFNLILHRSGVAPESDRTLTVLATVQQQLVAKAVVNMQDRSEVSAAFSPEKWPTGVVVFTVLNGQMQPLAERAAFVNSHPYGFKTQVHPETITADKLGKNEISLEIPEGLSANLSVSVTDGALIADSTNNIISDLLLSQELRGKVSNPAYYFSAPADSASAYLDLVMLTHGWRRIKWEEVAQGKLPQLSHNPLNTYLAIQGQVTGSGPFDSGDSLNLLLVTKDHKKSMFSLPISADGSFQVGGMFFYDSVQIVYRLNHPSKLGTNGEVRFQTSLLETPLAATAAQEPSFQWSRVPDGILEKEINGLLAELKNYSRQSKGMDYIITPHPKIDAYKNTAETIAHYLETNFGAFKFPRKSAEAGSANGDGTYAALQQSAPPAKGEYKPNVNLVVDGIPVSLDELRQMSMREVMFIKFQQKSSPKDLQTLAITTRAAIDQDALINSKTGFAVVGGYTPAKEFYVPGEDPVPSQEPVNDYRTTLYWNPHVLLDKDHRKVTLRFENNAITTRFRVVVEGMSPEGKLTRSEQTFRSVN